MGEPRVAAGSKLPARPSAAFRNDTIACVEDWQRRRQLGTGGRKPEGGPPKLDIVKVRNLTGENLRRGEVVELGPFLLAELEQHFRWFEGLTPDMTRVGWGVTLKPIPENDIDEVLVLGACIAWVNITDESHKYAERVNGNRVLQSAARGPVKFLHRPTGGTPPEERECVVQIMDEGGDLVDIVQVDESGSYGDVVIRDMSIRPAFQGKIRRYDAGSDNLSDEGYCWILFVDDYGNVLWDTACVNGEFYGPAKYVGRETFDFTELPTYVVRRGELVEMVQVYHSADTPPASGDVVAGLPSGYHPGVVVRYDDSSTLDTFSPCWIQFTTPFNGLAVQSQYYGPAKYAGIFDLVEDAGEETETHDRRPVFIVDHGEHAFPGRFDAAIADGASGTFSVYHPQTLTDSGINLTVSCHGDSIIEGKGFAQFVAGKWFGSNSECTTSEEVLPPTPPPSPGEMEASLQATSVSGMMQSIFGQMIPNSRSGSSRTPTVVEHSDAVPDASNIFS